MTYRADLREDSWLGARGHEHARPYHPRQTVAFNDLIKAQEREKARKSAENAAKKRKTGDDNR